MLLDNLKFLLNGCSEIDTIQKKKNDKIDNKYVNDNKKDIDPNANMDIWKQIGQDIDGDHYGDYSGFSVSLSDDGNIVAVGAYGSHKSTGIVRIYKNTNNSWIQMGQDIKGYVPHDNTGYSVSLNSDGSIIAIGATQSTFFGLANPHPGYVRIFQFKNNTWTQIGQDIDGEAAYDLSGYSVSLSDDGNIVGIGAFKNDGDINNPKMTSGHVRIYQFKNNSWIQIGQDIDGEFSNDTSGFSVSLNSNGNIIAIGAPFGGGGTGPQGAGGAGSVRIYQNINNSWIKIGEDIDGENNDDMSGYSISINADGSIIAIGSIFNNLFKGHARIYARV